MTGKGKVCCMILLLTFSRFLLFSTHISNSFLYFFFFPFPLLQIVTCITSSAQVVGQETKENTLLESMYCLELHLLNEFWMVVEESTRKKRRKGRDREDEIWTIMKKNASRMKRRGRRRRRGIIPRSRSERTIPTFAYFHWKIMQHNQYTLYIYTRTRTETTLTLTFNQQYK